MNIGIIGSEGAKFTPETEEKAREAIRRIILPDPDCAVWEEPHTVVSGACHLGGIDVWAIEEAKKAGLEYKEFPPEYHSWPAYKARNLQIVEHSDKVVCITLKELPQSYTGMRFKLCYHCGTDDHVKSGGCWTMHQARKQGKDWQLIVI